MEKKYVQSLLLFIAAVFFSLFVMEALARIIVYFNPQSICETYSDQSEHFLCRLEFNLSKSNDQNSQGLQLDQNICDKWDPQLGWTTSANCRIVREKVKYSTNSEGFRNLEEFGSEKNKKRIIVVGDSFTWGENNFDNETYPYYLSELFKERADIINMGVHGYGPDQFYLHFERDGLKYNPDIVVFALYLPDIHRTSLNVYAFFKPRFIIENDKLVLDSTSTIPDLRTALEMSAKIKTKPHLYSISYLYGMYSKFFRLITSYRHETDLTLKIIDKLNNQLKNENITLVVLLIPEQGMVEGNTADYHGVMPKITKYLDEKGVGYINLQPVFKNETKSIKKSLYLGHLTSLGNKIVANQLYEYFNKKPR